MKTVKNGCGSVRKMQGTTAGEECRIGELLGDPLAHREGRSARFSYEILTDSRLYRMRRKDFDAFLCDNPRLLMNLIFEGR